MTKKQELEQDKKDLIHNTKVTEEVLRENLFGNAELKAHAKREINITL